MPASDKWISITKYLAGECSEQERVAVEKWIKTDPEIRESAERLLQIWKASDKFENYSKMNKIDLESEWERLRLKMHTMETHPPVRQGKASGPALRDIRTAGQSGFSQLLKVAAIILVMLGGGYLLTQVLYTGPAPVVTELESEPHFREIATSTSQLAGLELTDGSKVRLSVESSLRVSDQFNRSKREVYVAGHAYFDVLTDSDRPFVIETSHAIMTVVGTDFTVRSYPDDDYVQLVVASGTVALESRIGNGKSEEILSNGQMGLLNKMTGELTVMQVDADRYLAWMDGKILFNETPLSQVSRDLERWFGIEMDIVDTSLENLRLTAELSNRSLSHVLRVISHTLNVEFETKDDRVWIIKGPVTKHN